MRHILQKINSKNPHENYSFFEEQERRYFLSRYLDSNVAVAREYFDAKLDPLFSAESVGSYNGTYQGLTVENMTVVLTKAILFEEPRSSKIINALIKIGKGILKKLSESLSFKDLLKRIVKKMRLI